MKLRISSKMLSGYLAMAGLILVGGLVALIYTSQLQKVTSQILAENVSSLKAAQELEIALFRMRGLTFNYILDGDPRWITILEERKSESLSWLGEAKETARSPEEQSILHEISLLYSRYENDLRRALILNEEGKANNAKAILLHASRDVFAEIYEKCEAFVSVNERDMYAAEEKINKTIGTMRSIMYGLGIAGIILGVILGLVISRSIVNPIYELVLKVKGAASAELVKRVDLEGGTELEELDRHVRDLIHRINATEADLEKKRRLLEHAEKLATLGRVSAGVAHEIRNPLTAIKMLIFSIREDLSRDDDKRQDLDIIVREIERIERFVQNFLQFTRPPEPSYAVIDVNESMRETLAFLAPRLRQFEVDLSENYQAQPAKIFADPDQIKQVIMNLILNALESMPAGGRLLVETRLLTIPAHNGNGRWVQLKVSDSGSGISEELMDSLFDPFVSGREDGIGLGLSIAHQIVQRHGGQIEAKNNSEGGGASFLVSLPYKNGQ